MCACVLSGHQCTSAAAEKVSEGQRVMRVCVFVCNEAHLSCVCLSLSARVVEALKSSLLLLLLPLCVLWVSVYLYTHIHTHAHKHEAKYCPYHLAFFPYSLTHHPQTHAHVTKAPSMNEGNEMKALRTWPLLLLLLLVLLPSTPFITTTITYLHTHTHTHTSP